MAGGNVLPQFSTELALIERPRQKAYRAAVAQVIRKLKSDYGLSNVALAEEIGCSDETISNADNENNDLSAVYLLSIAWRFGETSIAPIRALYIRERQAEHIADDHRAAIERHAAALARMVEI